MEMHGHSPGVVLRSIVIGLTAFLTVVDLFATQAILPSLTRHYSVTPAAMGFAVNASTMGMAVAGLVVGFFSRAYRPPARHSRQPRRAGDSDDAAWRSRPNLTVFTILRVMQGLCMASAFALTLAYLGEQCSAMDAGGAFAAYITGNVASNLIGRLVSAAVVDTSRAGLEFLFLRAAQPRRRGAGLFHHPAGARRCMRCRLSQSPFAAMIAHWRNPRAARRLRHRLLHPVRLHRHFHLRQFRAGAPAACRSG